MRIIPVCSMFVFSKTWQHQDYFLCYSARRARTVCGWSDPPVYIQTPEWQNSACSISYLHIDLYHGVIGQPPHTSCAFSLKHHDVSIKFSQLTEQMPKSSLQIFSLKMAAREENCRVWHFATLPSAVDRHNYESPNMIMITLDPEQTYPICCFVHWTLLLWRFWQHS